MKILNEIINRILNSFSIIFDTNSDIMSREDRKVLSNEDDRKKVSKAIERIKKGERIVSVVIYDGEVINFVK